MKSYVTPINETVQNSELRCKLGLKLFGPMSLVDVNGRMITIRGRKARAIFALLALSPGPVLRDTLINTLWSRSPRYKAQTSLRQSVYEIQEALQDLGTHILTTERYYLSMDHQSMNIDVRSVQMATCSRPEPLALIKGILLEELSGVDSVFDVWLEARRESIIRHADFIAKSVLHESKSFNKKIIAAKYILTRDINAHHAWHELIGAYIKSQQLDAAVLAKQRYKDICGESDDLIADDDLYPIAEFDNLIDDSGIELSADTDSLNSAIYEDSSIKIAVLKLQAFDQVCDVLAKGLTEEIMTSLSKFRGISCFSPATLALNGREADSSSTGNVDFLIEGSVQQGVSNLRITVHLADLRNHGEIIWSQRFDRELQDILTIQTDVSSEVVAQIDPQLTLRRGLRTKRDQDAPPTSLEYTLWALPAIHKLDYPDFIRAGEMLRKAVSRNPGNGAAHAWWAYWHLLLLGQGWAENPSDAENRTWELAKRAITLDPGDARALALAGHVQAFTHRRIDEAMALHERALSINPNLPIGWLFSGLAHTYAGLHDEAVRRIQHAMKLSPFDPHAFFFEMGLTLSFSLRGDDRQAAIHGCKAAAINPSFSSTFKAYLSALGFVGSQSTKEDTLAQLLILEPAFTVSSALRRSPLVREEDRAKFIEGLRLGGLPK